MSNTAIACTEEPLETGGWSSCTIFTHQQKCSVRISSESSTHRKTQQQADKKYDIKYWY